MVQVEAERLAARQEDRPRFLRRRVSPGAQKTQSLVPITGDRSKWEELPESLLALILNQLECTTQGWQTMRALFAMSTVCRSWRNVIAPRLFQNLWEGPSPMVLTHPAQLFALSPRMESPLVKCFIVRESQTGKLRSGSVLFRLYLGNDPASTHSKFLLSATQHPWYGLGGEWNNQVWDSVQATYIDISESSGNGSSLFKDDVECIRDGNRVTTTGNARICQIQTTDEGNDAT